MQGDYRHGVPDRVIGDTPPAALLRPAAEDVLRSWPVSRDVNSPRHDRPDLLSRVMLPTMPEDEDLSRSSHSA